MDVAFNCMRDVDHGMVTRMRADIREAFAHLLECGPTSTAACTADVVWSWLTELVNALSVYTDVSDSATSAGLTLWTWLQAQCRCPRPAHGNYRRRSQGEPLRPVWTKPVHYLHPCPHHPLGRSR